jgi:hypothetical protein
VERFAVPNVKLEISRVRPSVSHLSAAGYAFCVMTLALAAGGCGQKTQSTLDPIDGLATQPTDGSAGMASAGDDESGVRVLDLVARSESLQATARRLPGGTPEEHRRLVHEAFSDLSQILTQLVGPEPAGSYRQQLMALERARGRLTDESTVLATEPTIDTGLRAAHGALGSLQRENYPEEQELAATLDRLNQKVMELDRVRGALHRTVAGEAVEIAGDAAAQMVAALSDRLGEGGAEPAATAPEGTPTAP